MSGGSGQDDGRGHGGVDGAQSQNSATRDNASTRWTLPAWLDHFNQDDLKMLARCWAACWTGTLLNFIQPTLTNLGQTAFFVAFVTIIVPPTGVLFVYLLAVHSLLLGMCLAWAWGILVMKAAQAARPQVETDTLMKQLQAQAAINAQSSGQTVAWEAQVLVNNGFFLDARVTIIYYVLICLFVYVLARLRVANPKFFLLQMLGTNVSTLFLIAGPSLPAFTPILAQALVKPAAIGVGIASVFCMLLFPQSTSYAALASTSKLVAMTEGPLRFSRRGLDDKALALKQLQASQAAMVGLYKGMQPTISFLPLDFSRGRWSAEDIKDLQGPVREALIASLTLLEVHIGWVTAAMRERDFLRQGAEDELSDEKGSPESKHHHAAGHREISETNLLMSALKNPEHEVMGENALDTLDRTTEEILGVTSASVDLVVRCIRLVNSCRWFRTPSQRKFDELILELEATLERQRTCRAAYMVDATEGVIDAYADIFDDQGNLKSSDHLGPPMFRGIFIAMVVEDRIIASSRAMEKLVDHVLQLMKTRTTRRVWLPSSVQRIFTWVLSAKDAVPLAGTFTDPTENPSALKDPASLRDHDAQEAYRRLRASRIRPSAVSIARRGVGSVLVSLYKWLSDPAGMFALRMVIATIATAIPSSIPSTAGFFYRQNGLWVVITAQTSAFVYMADFTFSLVICALGAVFGGLLGMLGWYIGSGGGEGNPYGLSSISAVVVVLLMWFRLYLPPVYIRATILTSVTFYLVMTLSYDKNHLPQYGLPGIGYQAFWKRTVTVLIGFAVAAIVQVFPTPPSATKHVSQSLSKTVSSLADHYALLLSHWCRGSGGTQQHSPLGAVAEEISLDVAESLLSLDEIMSMLKFELTTMPFDQATLRGAQDHCQTMNQCLRRLLSLSSSLSEGLQNELARTFGLLDDRVVGEVMAVLSVVEQALMTGSPLPERLPTPLVRHFYESWHEQRQNVILTKSLIRDEDYRRFCVAVSSYLKFLSVVDDLVLLLKRASGECHILHRWEDV